MTEVSKTAVVVETSRYRVRGNVAVPTDARLSDYANEGRRDFSSVTEALVAPLDNPERERRVNFILVARHEIGVMLPADEEADLTDRNETRERAADHLWSFMDT